MNNQTKTDNRVVWLAVVTFSAGVVTMGVHNDWALRGVGSFGILISLISLIAIWSSGDLAFPFIPRGSLSRRENEGMWLGLLMFAAGVLFQGYHEDVAFWIAGGVGVLWGGFCFFTGRSINFKDDLGDQVETTKSE
jgi:hypothetical protein